MKIQIRHKILVTLFVSMAVIVSLGYAAYSFVNNVVDASRWSANSQHVLFYTEQIRSSIAEASAAKLRYAISKDSDNLKQFVAIHRRLKLDRGALDSLVQDSHEQRYRVRLLGAALDSAAKISTHSQTDSITSQIIHQIQQEENGLRRNRQATATSQFYKFMSVSALLLVVWLGSIIVLLVVLKRNLAGRDRAEARLSIAAAEIIALYENAPCGYFTLNSDGIIVKINRTLLTWLGLSKTAVTDRLHLFDITQADDASILKTTIFSWPGWGDVEVGLMKKHGECIPALINYTQVIDSKGVSLTLCSVIDNGERKKAEEEIKRANNELEAFSYSVSHDLRAPLRSINGYGQILMEDFGDKIDDEGKRVLGVIIESGKRMGHLIDDLLDFSRTSRKDLTRSSIQMDEFVRAIAKELLERETDRKIDFRIDELDAAPGDPSMMRQVWVNLISNALKYSRKRDMATIRVGCVPNGNEVVYHIRDNGAGFSMEYYDKLFGVFQRLHKRQEFEGTGVGLALVKRIIERHGGRIWAEAKLNEGASFYFSIPKQLSVQSRDASTVETVTEQPE